MSIMGCYQDKRAIENELGGKWELFFEETFEESTYERLHWDKDIDFTPLHLNGVMIVITEPNGTTTTANTQQFWINGNYMAFIGMGATTTTEDMYTKFIATLNNGALNVVSHLRVPEYGNVTSRNGGRVVFTDAITDIDIRPNASTQLWAKDVNIKVYVLRGV